MHFSFYLFIFVSIFNNIESMKYHKISKISKIYPINTVNTNIFHYNPYHDIYRYGSKERKQFKKRYNYNNLVQDHHVIPKQWKNHKLIKTINYDINSCNNLIIMPIPKAIYIHNLNPLIRTHFNGHNKYNSYVKYNLDLLEKLNTYDEQCFYFWLFYTYLKDNLYFFDNNIPWK